MQSLFHSHNKGTPKYDVLLSIDSHNSLYPPSLALLSCSAEHLPHPDPAPTRQTEEKNSATQQYTRTAKQKFHRGEVPLGSFANVEKDDCNGLLKGKYPRATQQTIILVAFIRLSRRNIPSRAMGNNESSEEAKNLPGDNKDNEKKMGGYFLVRRRTFVVCRVELQSVA